MEPDSHEKLLNAQRLHNLGPYTSAVTTPTLFQFFSCHGLSPFKHHSATASRRSTALARSRARRSVTGLCYTQLNKSQSNRMCDAAKGDVRACPVVTESYARQGSEQLSVRGKFREPKNLGAGAQGFRKRAPGWTVQYMCCSVQQEPTRRL